MSRLPWKTVTNSLKTWSYIIIIIIQIVNYLEQRHWLTFRLGMSRQVCQSTKTKAVDPEADGSHPCLISHLPPISCDERLSTCGHSFACPLASGSSAPHQRVLLLPGPPTQEVDLLFLPRDVPTDRPSASAATAQAARYPLDPSGASSQLALSG